MGFAGSLTISEETLSGLLVEVGRSLGQHGIKNLILVNGHGGNGKAVGQAADRLSSTGELTTRLFPTREQFFRLFLEEFADHFDSHSGVEETSRALHAFPELVDMSTAHKPHLQLDDDQLQAIENREENPETYRQLLSPLPPLHELTDTGALTLLDIAEHASADLGERNFQRFVGALVSLVKELEAV
jgi:creatinine amidohydrolase